MSLTEKESSPTARLREIIWPIKRDELPLFIPMALLMFCVLFNFGSLRSLKDSLVIPAIGAEVISFLKFWLVLPSAVLFTVIYAKLSNSLKFEYVFYTITTGFLIFFIIFAFFIYPNQDFYHPNSELICKLCEEYTHFQWFIKLSGKWSYSLMYIFGELWSVVVINLMFWQFANNITDTKDAKRFYPVYGMIGNLGLIAAGNALIAFSTLTGVPKEVINFLGKSFSNESEVTLKLLTLAIVLAGISAMLIFRYINTRIIPNRALKLSLNLDDTTKLSLKESFNLIMSSKYLGHILVLIICYGLTINIVEGPWKGKIRELYPTTREYMAFMGNFNKWLGISCVIFMIFGSNILRTFSWRFAALVTPIMILITGTLFFTFIVFESEINASIGKMIFNPVYAAVLLGAMQNLLSKASKYSLFDSTKEMAYIPLSNELKTKGKAAVEVVGIKFGKSMGALIQSTIFSLIPFATFELMAPYLMVVFITVLALWLINVNKLYYEYSKITCNY
jgi:ADP/ATP carrier protein family